MQHPPFDEPRQLVYPSAVLQETTSSLHESPAGQQPTGPLPVSLTVTHVSPVAQQASGWPIEVQFDVPVGHLKSRSNRLRPKMRGR